MSLPGAGVKPMHPCHWENIRFPEPKTFQLQSRYYRFPDSGDDRDKYEKISSQF